jgi:hypothetical protein
MTRLRILGLTLLALFALGAIAANVALAEEGVLPPSNFTIKGGEQKLENLNGESITCTSVEGTGKPLPVGEKDRDTHSTGTLDFLGCKAMGFSANTLPDLKEVILAEVLYLLCLFGKSQTGEKLDWGVLVEPKNQPIHIEIPALKALILVKGAIIGELLTELKGKLLEGEPSGTVFGVDFLKEDTTTRTKCSLKNLGEWTATYEAALDTKPDVDAWQVGEADITFTEKVMFMDE